MTASTTKEVSVIVCTRNVGRILERCLQSIIAANPRELIIVDGKSTDDTLTVARKYTDKVISDEGQGLAYARNLGLDLADGKYVFYVGPDNILLPDTLSVMLAEKEKYGWTGVSAMTRVYPVNNYLSWAINEYKIVRFKPGEKPVIGTPWLYDRDILKKFRYTSGLISSDDTDLCERLRADGYRVGISSAIVYEINDYTYRGVIGRWMWYGNSDAEFWRQYSAGWNWSRKLKSILHPLVDDFLKPSSEVIRRGKIFAVFFFAFITLVRYLGWIKSSKSVGKK